MDIFSQINRFVAVIGPVVHLLAAGAWIAVFYSWSEIKAFHSAYRIASAKKAPPPEPNAWVRHARVLSLAAWLFLWLSAIHWGQLQQVPVRG